MLVGVDWFFFFFFFIYCMDKKTKNKTHFSKYLKNIQYKLDSTDSIYDIMLITNLNNKLTILFFKKSKNLLHWSTYSGSEWGL